MAEQEQSMTRILDTIRDMIDKGDSPEDDTQDSADATPAMTDAVAPGETGRPEYAPGGDTDDAMPAEGLISDRARHAVEGSVRSLVETSRHHPPSGAGRAEGIEAMVMEHLGPVLRSWLDEHLPGIVERIVEREVRDLIQHAGGTKT